LTSMTKKRQSSVGKVFAPRLPNDSFH
jgi:hypothetical protein